jgi:hypothetical protein
VTVEELAAVLREAGRSTPSASSATGKVEVELAERDLLRPKLHGRDVSRPVTGRRTAG